MNSHPLYLNLERHKHQTNIKRIGLYILFSVAGQILLILHHINKNLKEFQECMIVIEQSLKEIGCRNEIAMFFKGFIFKI